MTTNPVMKALVLNKPGHISMNEVPDPGEPGHDEVRVRVGAVGICGSDVHYYEHGRIGDFVVEAPMVLGHESAGTVESVGPGVSHLVPGDRVAMEPGVPCGDCDICSSGRYNLCADMQFWATPPFDGSLAEYVVHPAGYSHLIPDSMSLEQGALIEPLAVGIHACNRARVKPGDSVLIIGAGTIGCVTLLAARAYGAEQIIVSDVVPERLERAMSLGATSVVDGATESLSERVSETTEGRGVDVGFECSGAIPAPMMLLDAATAGGRIVLIGMGNQPVEIDTVTAMVKEVDIRTVFRYTNAFPRAIEMAANDLINVSSLVTDRYSFDNGVDAFDYARNLRPETCKVMINF